MFKTNMEELQEASLGPFELGLSSRDYFKSLSSKEKFVVFGYVTNASNAVNGYLLSANNVTRQDFLSLRLYLDPTLFYAQAVDVLQTRIDNGTLNVSSDEEMELKRPYSFSLAKWTYSYSSKLSDIIRKYSIEFSKADAKYMIEDFIATLFQILERAPKLTSPLVVYRGFEKGSERSVLPTDTELKFFTSTSTSPRIAQKFTKDLPDTNQTCCLAVFYLPVGYPAFLLDPTWIGHELDEKEVILNLGTHIKYLGSRNTLPGPIMKVFRSSIQPWNVFFYEVELPKKRKRSSESPVQSTKRTRVKS